MNKLSIVEKALSVYPEKIETDQNGLEFDANEKMRYGYIKACRDILNPNTVWNIFQAGKEVCDDLRGDETTICKFGTLMLKKIKI